MCNFFSVTIPTNRFAAMLHLIPRAPESISTEELQHELSKQDFDVELRTVQRNLKDLVEFGQFGLAKEKSGRDSARWQFVGAAPPRSYPRWTTTLPWPFAWPMGFCCRSCPPETIQALRPFVEQADKHLSWRRQSATV
jgi:hypothetical protein